MADKRGRLISAPVWRIHCAECDAEDTAAGYQMRTHMEAAEWFVGLGWRKGDAGWVCPEHYAKGEGE
jgi:hypothetical protein